MRATASWVCECLPYAVLVVEQVVNWHGSSLRNVERGMQRQLPVAERDDLMVLPIINTVLFGSLL